MKQNKKWSMRIASFCLAGACLCGGAVLAAGGDESDPLVTLSYLTQTVTPNILKPVDEQAAKRQSELLAQLNTAIADYKMAVEGGGASGGRGARTRRPSPRPPARVWRRISPSQGERGIAD